MAARQRALPLSTHLVTSRHSLDSNFVCRRPSVTATARNLPLIPPSWLGQRMNARPTQAAQRAGLDSAHHGASTARISTAGCCSPRREHGTHLNGRLLLSTARARHASQRQAAAHHGASTARISTVGCCSADALRRLHLLHLLRLLSPFMPSPFMPRPSAEPLYAKPIACSSACTPCCCSGVSFCMTPGMTEGRAGRIACRALAEKLSVVSPG